MEPTNPEGATNIDKVFGSKKAFVVAYYKPARLVAMRRTDGGFGIFSANANINKPPHTLGIGDSKKEAWNHAFERIREVENV